MHKDDHSNGLDQVRLFWEKACVDFYLRLLSYARRLAYRKTYEAEDLVQATVCRSLYYSKNPEGIENPLGYLLRIMRNVAIDMNKKNRLEVNLDDVQAGDPQNPRLVVEPEILRILKNEGFRQELKLKQGPLSPVERQLLKMLLEDLPENEIAARLMMSVACVKARVNALRTKLRYRLTKGKAKTKGSGQP